MRLVAWNVQPVIMVDDGQTLTPVNVNPQQIPAALWEGWKAGEDAKALEQLKAQMEMDAATNGHGRKEDLPFAKHGPGKRAGRT